MENSEVMGNVETAFHPDSFNSVCINSIQRKAVQDRFRRVGRFETNKDKDNNPNYNRYVLTFVLIARGLV